ncbi:hypothetical protein S21ZY_104 [Pseudomonas phage ZY21]|nr:hypothetical protein S21ZY_104 [Pseudomonas phage ZY21]
MSQDIQGFWVREMKTYKQSRFEVLEGKFSMNDHAPLSDVMEENAAIKRALAMVIEQKSRDREGQMEVVRKRIEQAELDAIALQFEEEERQKRLDKLGAGSWA